MKVKYLILGAGPAGVTFANRLLELGIDNFMVIEKEKEAGGLCRSKEIDGGPVDIGGGHFLDVCRPRVNKFLFRFMPENEWNLFERDSRIAFEKIMIGYPFEANIWQMPQNMQVEYLKSIAIAGCNIGLTCPERFTEWIKWKLGDLIAQKYMIPYNSKIFGKELDKLGTYWLEKLPNVSFDETLLSCLNRKPYGSLPGHTQFYYPKKYGYGELWKRMAWELQGRIICEETVESIDFGQRSVKLCSGRKIEAEAIIMTIPWTDIAYVGMPTELKKNIEKLRYVGVDIRYYEETLDTDAQWIYYPDEELPFHRILVRSNFARGSRGYWTETNSERDNAADFKNLYAYPLNTVEKPRIMRELLEWSAKQKVYGLGRWGEWQHYNSDVTVERALDLADYIEGEKD